MNRTLVVGRIVRFVCRDGSERPAVVVQVGSPVVLRVLLGVEGKSGSEFTETERVCGTALRLSRQGVMPGNWSWPPESPVPPKTAPGANQKA